MRYHLKQVMKLSDTDVKEVAGMIPRIIIPLLHLLLEIPSPYIFVQLRPFMTSN